MAGVTESETHDKLQKLFQEGLLCTDKTPKYFKLQTQKLSNLCKSSNESITFLASLLSNEVEGNKCRNVGFVLHLLAVLSKKGEVVANTITDFGDILSFLIMHATSRMEASFQVQAMRCLANVSKWKSGKFKLPQMSGFVSYLCSTIKQGKVNEGTLFAISVLSRILEVFENRSNLGPSVECFGETSFYDTIGEAAVGDASDYAGHACRLILHLSRVDQHRSAIAQSKPAINALKSAIQLSIREGVASVSSRCAVVAVMNLAGYEGNRIILATTDDLISVLVQFSSIDVFGKTFQYCLAALLNLAWENSNRALIMGADGVLNVLVTAIMGSDEKASMYGVGVICNLSCVATHKLLLGQCSQPDVVAALVHAVRLGTGFTQDDAIGSLANLSAESLNRIIIARQFEKLNELFGYIRTHHGICRQRAILLLQNLSTSYSSMDYFLMNEPREGDSIVKRLDQLLDQCKKEPALAIALQYCVDCFKKRQTEIEASVGSALLRSSAKKSSGFRLDQAKTSHLNKDTHAAQLFEILKKSKAEKLGSHQPKNNVDQNLGQEQQAVVPQLDQHPATVSHVQEVSHKQQSSLSQNQQHETLNELPPEKNHVQSPASPNRQVSLKYVPPALLNEHPPSFTQNQHPDLQMEQQVPEQQKGCVEQGVVLPASSKPNTDNVQVSVSKNFSQLRESKTKAGRSMVTVHEANTHSPISSTVEIKKKMKKEKLQATSQEQVVSMKPESSLGEDSFVKNPEIMTREKHTQGRHLQNEKSDELRESREVNADPSTAHPFIGNRVTDMYYSSDENDEYDERYIRKHRRKSPHQGTKQERFTDLSRKLFDDHAQPKIIKSRRWKERKRSLVKTRDYGKEHKRIANREDREEKAYSVADHRSTAHPPEYSCPSSSSRSIKIKKLRNFGMAESKAVQSKALPAEAKRPTRPSTRLNAESKRTNPFRGKKYTEELPVKEESKDFFSHTLVLTDDDIQAKEVAIKSWHNASSQPHKPITPKSSDSKRPNHHNTRETSPLSRSNNHHSLYNFFYAKCYVDEERAEVLAARAKKEGIVTPDELQDAIAHDRNTLENLGMTPVDVMLTLKGLEAIQSDF